jgi:hypothetical protein
VVRCQCKNQESGQPVHARDRGFRGFEMS